MSDSSRERFAQIVTASEEDLNLAEAALLIAKEEYPELDVQAYLRRFDLLAEEDSTTPRWRYLASTYCAGNQSLSLPGEGIFW